MNKRLKIVIAGDLLPSSDNTSLFEAGDVWALFDQKILDLFQQADFSIVNLEGPLTSAATKQRKVGPVLKAAPDVVHGISALGVTCMALANNHFTDYLQQGCNEALDTLDRASIKHIGAGINRSLINTHVSFTCGEKKICVYNVSESFFNHADEKNAGVNIYDEYIVCNEIKRLKQSHHFLIVIYHGGAEMCPYPTPIVRLRFRRMSDCGADFITAQHTHCIGCMEQYGSSYLLYGQGNFFMEHMRSPLARQGLVTEIILGDGMPEIKQHVVRISSGKLIYDESQDLTSFYERTEEIKDEALATKRYEDFVWGNKDLKNKYYQAYKGNFFGRLLFRRFFPHTFMHYIENHYTQQQLSRIVFSLESDRMREEVCCLWKQLQKHQDERSQFRRIEENLF